LGLLPVFLLAFVAYAETLSYWFVGVDTLPLIATSRVQTTADFVEIFTKPLMHESPFVAIARFYRPVASLSYALDYWLWGLNPFGYHLTNVVFHAVAAVLVVYAVGEITNRPAVGYLSAGLFAVHPLTVEVVPSAERRQDILLAVFVLTALILFVRWYRHRRSGTLVGAAGAYALALGSKETAVVFPGMVLAWAFIYADANEWTSRFRASVRDVSPFVAVTVLYLLVRILALGGLGGYRKFTPPYSLVNAVLFVGKYLLWVAYPTNAVEEAVTAALSIPLLAVGLGILFLLLSLVWYGWGVSKQNTLGERLALVGPIVGFGAIPLVIVFAPRLKGVLLEDSMAAVVSYVVGLLFIGGCSAGIAVAARLRDWPFDDATKRQLLFFGSWLLGPLCLLLMSRTVIGKPLEIGIQMRNGYLSTIPAMAGLSLVLVTAVRNSAVTRVWEMFDVDANAVLVGFVVLLLLPSFVASSPLVHPTEQWEQSGQLNKQILTDVSETLSAHSSADTVCIVGLPTTVAGQYHVVQQVHSVTTLEGRSIKAWRSLHSSSHLPRIVLEGAQTVTHVPTRFAVTSRKTNETLLMWVRTPHHPAPINARSERVLRNVALQKNTSSPCDLVKTPLIVLTTPRGHRDRFTFAG
jgi:hypothetical protein